MPELWAISVSEKQKIASIADKLKDAGWSIKHVLSEIGVILAEGDDIAAAAGRNVDGISDISPNAIAGILSPKDSA